MSVRLRAAVALAATATLAVLFDAGPAVASTAPTTTADPAVAAAGWLAQQFVDSSGRPAPKGDHFDFPGTTFYWGGLTASGVFALAAAKVGADKIDDALTYMAQNAASDSNVGNGSSPGPYDGSVATYALAAIVGGVDPTDFGGLDLLQTLQDDECTVVSVPVDNNDFTTPNCPVIGAARNLGSSVSESLAMLAEARGAAEYGSQYEPTPAGVNYFLSLQCPGGGFTGKTSACTSDSDASVDETAYASAALAALGNHGTALASANAWLISQRNAAGYWVVQGGPDVDSTALAVAALDSAGQNVTKSRAWLVSQQVTDGPTVGAGAERGALKYQGSFDASSSIKGTADGVLGLAVDASLATLTAHGASTSVPVLALDPAKAKTGSVRAGSRQTVTASGFAAGETVRGVLHSAPLAIGSAKASATGAVTLSFTVPATLTPGAHTVVLTGATSGLSTTTASFRVTAAPTTSGPTTPTTPSAGGADPSSCDSAQLACTGRDGRQTQREVVFGLGLLLAGVGAVFAGRRRRA